MNKININLNPKKIKDAGALSQNILSYKPFLILSILLISGLILFLNLFLPFRLNSYKSHMKEWKQWEERYNLIAKLKEESLALEQQKTILQSAVLPQIEMAKIFADIFGALGANIWFSSLHFKDGSLILEGYVVKLDEDYLVSLDKKFILPLKEKEYFSSKFKKINIKNTKKVSLNNVEALEFSLECAN